MRILDHLLKAIQNAAVFNPDVTAAPVCILWPDRDKQWEAVIPRLQNELSQLCVLGDYNPDKLTGPAIWLRCLMAKKTKDVELPGDKVPILYLPGVSRQDLRAVETCSDDLKPLAELQYRGVIWSQINAKDWTILAFLKSDQGGLGLDVAQDSGTKNAMQLALYLLLEEKRDLLENKRLDKDYFNTLLTGGDPVRDLLLWLDHEKVFIDSRGDNEWKAFIEVCKSQLAFNPLKDGVLSGAFKLAEHKGPWKAVWERFCEAPKRYPNIPDLLCKCQMPSPDLFSNEKTHGGWPQWNEFQENKLQKELSGLIKLPPHEAGKKIKVLIESHVQRKNLVWSELGFSPLALAGEHLAILAEITSNQLAAGTAKEMAQNYSNWGWKADAAVIKALACVEKNSDFRAVSTAIRSIYLSWMEDSAQHLQKVVDKDGYPGKLLSDASKIPASPGECIIFIDGLRFDTAKRLSDLLIKSGMQVSESITWAALPSVTATGKPAVAPVHDLIKGELANSDFEPVVSKTGKSLKGGYHLKKLLKDKGWSVLGKNETGDPSSFAWCEIGDIDHEGHDRGWKLAKHIKAILRDIKEQIDSLIAAGWKTIRIVTDHGWLLLPEGLPKIDLPSVLTENKWGRCAAIKPGADSNESLYPWYWNPNQYFALSNGISCYKKGEEYAHGGLSLQECLTLELKIHNNSANKPESLAKITDIKWKGLRCTVAVDGNFAGLTLDIRTQAGSSSSSIVMNTKPVKKSGKGSVVIENEDLEGKDAAVVLLNKKGQLTAQILTKIGGE